jgi:hypothetical protein
VDGACTEQWAATHASGARDLRVVQHLVLVAPQVVHDDGKKELNGATDKADNALSAHRLVL